MNNIIEIIKNKSDVIAGVPSSQKSINNAERILNLFFSHDYKEYLLNFGCMIIDGREITGICNNKLYDVVYVTKHNKLISPNIPFDWYVIEQLNIDGIVIWQSSTGEIYQTAPGTEPIKICDSFCEYILG